MEFDIDQGDDLAGFLRAIDDEGTYGDIAREILADRPELTPYEAYFNRVFDLLSRSRQIGMSVGPIPIDVIWQYIDRQGLSRMRGDILQRVIMNMDAAFVGLHAERTKKAAKEQTPK